jgi:hypothetical protein
MKKAIPTSARSVETPKTKSRSSPRSSPALVDEGGRLDQMSGIANRSPGVQAQRKLAEDLSRGIQADSQRNPAAETMQMQALNEKACTNAAGCPCAACSTEAQPPAVSQAKLATAAVAQLTCKVCGKDKGHYSDCPRHKHNRGVKAQEQQEEHEESSSWTNMQAYRPGWIKKNGITEELVRRFCKETKRKIRGHHSGDKSKEEQENTKKDLDVYKSWHMEKFDEWN